MKDKTPDLVQAFESLARNGHTGENPPHSDPEWRHELCIPPFANLSRYRRMRDQEGAAYKWEVAIEAHQRVERAFYQPERDKPNRVRRMFTGPPDEGL